MIFYKRHEKMANKGGSIVIAMCDENLIGKKLKGKNVFLDLDAYRSFYVGEKVSLKQAQELLAEYFPPFGASVVAGGSVRADAGGPCSFNLVGKESLSAVKQWVDVSKAKKIGSVPHLQVYKV